MCAGGAGRSTARRRLPTRGARMSNTAVCVRSVRRSLVNNFCRRNEPYTEKRKNASHVLRQHASGAAVAPGSAECNVLARGAVQYKHRCVAAPSERPVPLKMHGPHLVCGERTPRRSSSAAATSVKAVVTGAPPARRARRSEGARAAMAAAAKGARCDVKSWGRQIEEQHADRASTCMHVGANTRRAP